MARALVGAQHYPRDKVATHYHAWASSHPCDMGNATRAALSGDLQPNEPVADGVTCRAAKHNMESKANGALMRASALGIWSTRLTQQEAVDAAREDARLTHPT